MFSLALLPFLYVHFPFMNYLSPFPLCQILNIRRSLHLILHLLIPFSNILLCHAFVSSLVLVLLVVHTNQALSISLGDCYPSAKHGQSFSILFPQSWIASILFLIVSLLPTCSPVFLPFALKQVLLSYPFRCIGTLDLLLCRSLISFFCHALVSQLNNIVDSTTTCITIACVFLDSVVFFNLFLMVMRACLPLFVLCCTSGFLAIHVPSIRISPPAEVPSARCSSLPSWHCSSKFFMLLLTLPCLPSFHLAPHTMSCRLQARPL